ncbi:putative quinone oxidoreductase YhfP [bacterium BMS3Bbin12]|nr:putative quinone oxidoreductase YhfP [bacterium BMS3Bbin12]GBE49516.1 putative quinone oxidoreductase YhfP [bacterium BMS3Bbin13]HDK03148.1 acryloyl-CoA reductase [Gammaproteobacteria bacterium]
MDTFRAFRIHNDDGTARAGIERIALADLSPGEVVIRTAWSGVNYKDALAGTGKGKILRRFPLVGGIDVAGTVASSEAPGFREGDPVLVTGCGLSEVHDGGYAEYVRVPADWVMPLPDGLDLRRVMALGTAGFTAGLAVQRLEDNHQRPEIGPLVVTGASGGVGSFAVNILSGLGYEVVAVTGKPQATAYLKDLGASHVVSRQDLEMRGHPLENAQWGGALDNVGGEMLAWLTRSVRTWGNIVSIGMAGGTALHTTVMPFILRGIGLLGVTSAHCPMPLRRRIWERLATDLRPRALDSVVRSTIDLDGLPAAFEDVLAGKSMGRILVAIGQTVS